MGHLNYMKFTHVYSIYAMKVEQAIFGKRQQEGVGNTGAGGYLQAESVHRWRHCFALSGKCDRLILLKKKMKVKVC